MKAQLNKYRKQSLDTGINASKEVVHKTGEFLENKIPDTVAKLHGDKIVKADENSRNVEKITIPPEKRRRNIKRIKASITKMEHYKISKLLNNLSVSIFVTKIGSR